MTGEVRKPARPFGRFWAILIATLLLLCPGSASVLCLAPGGHAAIEDINAFCHVERGKSVSSPECEDNGLGAPDPSGGCTDIFLTPNGRSSDTNSYRSAAAGASADEGPDDPICAPNCLSEPSLIAITCFMDTSPPAISLSPMRC